MMRSPVLTATVIASLSAGGVAVHAQERQFDQQTMADAHGIVEISNFSGKVDVSGWDQPQVSVHADIPQGADKVKISSDRGRTTITVQFPNFSFDANGVRLKVRVPRASEVDVTGVSADVSTTELTGMQRLKSVSGSIRADIAQADVEAKTVSGDVMLRGQGKPGELHLTTISGSIRLDHAAGDVEANTTSGNIIMHLEQGRSVRLRTINGDVHLNGSLVKDADLDAQTVSGNIKVRAGAEAGYEYEVTTFNGDIANCFNVEAERPRHGPGQRLSGTLGKGNAHVRIKTMNGDVQLCDKP
jgi:DUF4097 and DUF4098 domain-containing protein YvlB